jgi:chromosomal replication initiation ATPase DnaA
MQRLNVADKPLLTAMEHYKLIAESNLSKHVGLNVRIKITVEDSKAFESKLKEAISKVAGLNWSEILQRRRYEHLVIPRQIYVWFMLSFTDKTYSSLARQFGHDHGTCMSTFARANMLIDSNDKKFMTPFVKVKNLMFNNEI